MRLGLLGHGPQATRYLMPENGGERIVTVKNRDEGMMDFVIANQLDGVIVATHPGYHFEPVKWCLEHRVPVLCEKPLALTASECEELFDLADHKEALLQVAHTHRWAYPWWQKLYRDTPPGAACHASCRWVTNGRDYDPWLDWGPHLVSLALETGATSREYECERGAERALSVTWVYPNGRAGESYDAYVPAFPRDSDNPEVRRPMRRMVDDFMMLNGTRRADCDRRQAERDFNRRVYRELFELAPTFT